MVQVTDHTQTLAALQLACALASSRRGHIMLLRLVPVSHPGWLGTDLGYMNLSDKDQQALRDYEKIVEGNGINVQSCVLQVVSSLQGIIEAADEVDAEIVFAQVPHSLIPFRHAWQTRVLRRSLESRQRQLYMLDYRGNPPDWRPSPPIPALFDTASNN